MEASTRNRWISIYQVDAFTSETFKGNPAAVCILRNRLNDTLLKSIAVEMNLSETAFVKPLENVPLKEATIFSLRWFTPEMEVSLCGHATLATAAVLFREVGINEEQIRFKTKSGVVTATKDKKGISLDFPSDNPIMIDPPKSLLKALGISEFKKIKYGEHTKKLLIHMVSGEDVYNLKPNYELMKSATTKKPIKGVIVTAGGSPPYDFVSRFFAPWVGINEDPVTGAAHTVLAPYWSKLLNKRQMLAYQASKRGGELAVRLKPNSRVDLIGEAVIVLKGELHV